MARACDYFKIARTKRMSAVPACQPKPPPVHHHDCGWVLILPGAIFVLGILVVAHVDAWGRLSVPPCLFHKLTGLLCPGCGGTRAIARLGQGDVAGALRANALVVLGGVAGCAAVAFRLTGVYHRLRGRLSGNSQKLLNWLVLTTVVVFTIFRNLSVHPFELLRP